MNKEFWKHLFLVFTMILFFILSYLFVDAGHFFKVRNNVNYYEKSLVNYQVLYNDSLEYLDKNNSYVGDKTDKIKFDFKYENIFNDYVNGFYKYNVTTKVVGVNNGEVIYTKSYNTVSDKAIILDQNNVNSIKIEDGFEINYSEYLEEYSKYIYDYDKDNSGYLDVSININQTLDFNKFDNDKEHEAKITINVPLKNDLYKIKVNSIDNVDSFYEVSYGGNVNYLLVFLGLVCFSLGIVLFILIIIKIYNISVKEKMYKIIFRDIIVNNRDNLINIKKFYNKKSYNVIYVNDFDTLLNLSIKLDKKIGYKVIKNNNRCIFCIIDKDNAWIYRLAVEDM